MNNVSDIVQKIKTGVLDVNVQELFFSKLIKGLIYNLNNDIKIRGEYVPHIIMHTGDDKMWMESKGYDNSIEPITISNENYVYQIVPRCNLTPSNIDLDPAQLSNPYTIGTLQYEDSEGIYTLYGEFRRMPIKMTIELKYTVESYTDMLELIQYIISNLSFIRTYDIMYLGQKIKCSYKIPDSFNDEHSMEIDGAIADDRDHKLNLSIEIESNIPVFNNKTIMSGDNIVVTPIHNIYAK